jgi:MFS family permease
MRDGRRVKLVQNGRDTTSSNPAGKRGQRDFDRGATTDRFDRRMVFYVTLIAYLLGVLDGSVMELRQFRSFPRPQGFGIGGDMPPLISAINSCATPRRTDVVVNGSFWLGAALGSGASLLFLDPAILPTNIGWRLGRARRHFGPRHPAPTTARS